MAYYLYKKLNANTLLRHEPLTGELEEVSAASVGKLELVPPQLQGRVRLSMTARRERAVVFRDARRRAIPIVKGLFVEPLGYSSDGEQRLALIFGEVWVQLPKHIRKLLRRFWRMDVPDRQYVQTHNLGGTGEFNYLVPRIQLVECWQPVDGKPVPHTSDLPVFGACRLNGFLLQFWAKSFDLMPNWAAKHIIAHELIHALLIASPEHLRCDEIAEERQVESMLPFLGFGEARDFYAWAGQAIRDGQLKNEPKTASKPTSASAEALEESPEPIAAITRAADVVVLVQQMHGRILSDPNLDRGQIETQLSRCSLNDLQWEHVAAVFGRAAKNSDQAIQELADYILARKRMMGA